ncbi:complement C1q and tumor necrosis factor-related protein 9A-like [Athene cunicularia]|uniref:complement C1q and tumor necrosis factor-related protein 9A-like n=1 Tax=Athene cunicularia TaxID=194338 RepID=UPI000EF66143|nr:complement C1q and tumor necrosis factor-related protein 9A-like [Athene cunicularia]
MKNWIILLTIVVSTAETQRQDVCTQGYPGIPGNPGHNGIPGRDGRDGQDGVNGEKGEQGPKGNTGDLGPQGNPGVQGERGLKGDRGDKGNVGAPAVLPKSAFSVGLTIATKFPPPNRPIKFDKVLYNSLNDYNAVTGKFTCKYPGVYYFTYHITVYSRNVRVALVKNGIKMLHTVDRYQGGEDQASGAAILELQGGDEVWLQAHQGETFNGLFADADDDTTFSGFLLFSTSDLLEPLPSPAT